MMRKLVASASAIVAASSVTAALGAPPPNGSGVGLAQDATLQNILYVLNQGVGIYPQGGAGVGLAQDATLQKILLALQNQSALGHGTPGQYLVTNAAGTASTWVSQSGDVSGSVATPGYEYVTSLNGGTQGSFSNSSTDYVSLGASSDQLHVTPSGLSVSGTGPSGGAAASLTLAPQAPNSTNGTPGGVQVNFAAPTGTGSEGYLTINRAGTPMIHIGTYPGNTGYGAIFFGPFAPSNTNANFVGNGGDAYFSAPSSAHLYFQLDNAITFIGVGHDANGGSGVQFFTPNFSFGGGSKVLGVANASQAPTSNPTGGGVLWEDASNGFEHRGSDGFVTVMAPVGTGTHNTQAAILGRVGGMVTDSGAGPTTIATISIPSGSTAGLEIHWQARQTATITNSAGGEVVCECYNSAGTVTCADSGSSVWAKGATFCGFAGPTLPSITCVASGANVLVQESCTSNTAATDYQVDVQTNID